MKKLLIAIVATMITTVARGEIQPVMVRISTNSTYTVPAGKALAIQNVYGIGNADSLYFAHEGVTNILSAPFFMQYHGEANSRYTAKYPLIIPENTVITGYFVVSQGYYFVLFGLVVDSADLFVSLDHQIDKIEDLDTMTLALGLQARTASPLRFKVDSTVDLSAPWKTEPGATVNPTTNKTKYIAAVPKSSADTAFYRTRAYPRRR